MDVMSGSGVMSDGELQAWVERVSVESFGWRFMHRARFNGRLRRTGGRYDLRTHDIEINPAQLLLNGADEVERIIKHELCHYHLHLQGRGFRHRDREFRALLAQVGGSRFCKGLPAVPGVGAGESVGAGSREPGSEVQGAGLGREVRSFRYVLICRLCLFQYPRRIRCNPARYACSRCRGRLDLYERDAEN